MVFGFAFCQAILPVAASIAKTVLSLPTTKTRATGPCGVFTMATTGAVMVERTCSWGTVEICAVHFTSRWATLSLLRIFSSGLEPVRSGSWPHVSHSLWAVASPHSRKNVMLNLITNRFPRMVLILYRINTAHWTVGTSSYIVTINN